MSKKYKNKGKNFRARNKNNHDDYFPTYHALTRLYLDNIVFDTNDSFLEPCAGSGDITKILREYNYNDIMQCDIKPRNNEIIKQDFLKEYPTNCKVDHIVTNPPFKLSVEFMDKCSKVSEKTISLLMPLGYLHGVDRYAKWYKEGINNFHLNICFPFVRRPLFGAQYDPSGLIPTGATSFAWFYFTKELIKDTKIKWIHNQEVMGKPRLIEQNYFKGI